MENQEGKQGFVPANHLKRAEPVVKSSQERLAEEARTVSDRQKQIENQYGDLKVRITRTQHTCIKVQGSCLTTLKNCYLPVEGEKHDVFLSKPTTTRLKNYVL